MELQLVVDKVCNWQVLDKIFSEFASIWMHMKIQGKNQEDSDGQHYKFRPRALRIENVMEVDISALGKFLANENFVEWKELLSEEESTETAGSFRIMDIDRLHSFISSYTLGVAMIKGV
ncbi:midasin-like protein [Corchorus olitorius]|uniref:Midasin-like protein n=1 Tax=Corchorus olitorius TaxID=93759 RepID=A0A1R3K0E3_9ROSI|nr:midasin-like protein [Corchorus olitorius]